MTASVPKFAGVTRVTRALPLLLLWVAAAVAGKSNQLPASFPRCSVSDPKLSSCLKSAVQVVIPELVRGVPSLGVLSIDPMEILEADISGTPKGPVAIALNFKKLRISGLGSAEVMSISYDPKAHRISMRAKVGAPLRLDGGYKIDGRVLVLPITGTGQCSLRLDDVTADLTLNAHEITKNGQKHLAVDKLALSFDTSKLHMRFDNLFNGNKELGETMNRFLNENWPDILRELKPSIDDTFGAAFQALASRIFMKVPYNNIFLP